MPESEPQGWELMRAIQRIEAQAQRTNDNMMTAAMFAVYQQGIEKQLSEISSDLAAEEAARKNADEKIEGKIEDRAKFKRAVYTSVGLAFLAALLSFGITLLDAGAT